MVLHHQEYNTFHHLSTDHRFTYKQDAELNAHTSGVDAAQAQGLELLELSITANIHLVWIEPSYVSVK